VALWQMGEAYGRLGNRFRRQEGEAYSRIVRDYPLSDYADDAAKKLKELEMPVPQADKAAVARMQFEKDHRQKPSLYRRETMFLRRGPDMSTAAHEGDPAMTNLRPSVPPLVPQPAGAGGAGFNGDVVATPVGNSNALDTKPDARTNPPSPEGAPAAGSQPAAGTTGATQQASQTSQQTSDKPNAKKKKKKEKKQQPAAAQPAAAQPASTTPPSN